MIGLKGFELRKYQESIVETCKEKNTLVCLPTGMGKTKIAVALGVERLNRFPGLKVVVCSPTKPLASQICEEFKECTTLPSEEVQVLTGMVKPSERQGLFESARVIIGTPQTIENDLKHGRIDAKKICLLVIDECHKSKEKFANTQVARVYVEKGSERRILALTASPGSTNEKIDQILGNLCIEAVEIRSEDDEDVKPYVQGKALSVVEVELSEEIKQVRGLVKGVYERLAKDLRYYGLSKPTSIINKRDLLMLQSSLQGEVKRGNYAAYSGLSLVAGVIKLSHVLDLLETQSLRAVLEYYKKLCGESSKAARNIVKEKSVVSAMEKVKEIVDGGGVHPKLVKLKEVVAQTLSDKKKSVIVFANYRNVAEEIRRCLEKIEGARPVVLIGQKGGLSQKEQIRVLQEFNEGVYNVIIATSIGEEGLSINELDLAVLYDHTASEIRKIQRSGRVGRVKPGSLVYLVAKGTRDEGLMWVGVRKEQKMRRLLERTRARLEKQGSLKDF